MVSALGGRRGQVRSLRFPDSELVLPPSRSQLGPRGHVIGARQARGRLGVVVPTARPTPGSLGLIHPSAPITEPQGVPSRAAPRDQNDKHSGATLHSV